MDDTLLAVSGLVGVVLSLLFSIVPQLKSRWAAIEPDQRRVFMTLVVAGATIGLYLLACSAAVDLSAIGLTFDCGGSWAEFALAVLLAVVTNQATFQLTPRGVTELPADNPAQAE